MSKNREERANYYLYIDGQAVPVSEQIYRVYQHYERKEEYFSYDLKTEKFQKDTASFLPSREDSYERLLEKDRQFAAPGKNVEQLALEHLEAEQIRDTLLFGSIKRRRTRTDFPAFLSRKDRTGSREYIAHFASGGQ